MEILKLIGIGLFSGISSGALGIGGTLVMIPALIYLMGFNQHLAQGTSLAILVLPIGILGAWRYYQAGNSKLSVVPWIAMGFFVGAYLGAHWVQGLNHVYLRRLFGFALLLLSLKMLLEKAP